SQALALRKANRLRVRLPLAEIKVVSARSELLQPFTAILSDELNVKHVVLEPLHEESAREFGIVQTLTVNARAAGPRLGREVQTAIKAAKSGDWHEVDGVVTAG